MNLCLQDIVDDKNDKKLNKLFELQDKNPDCELLGNLVCHRIASSDNKDVKFRDIRENLFKNPSQQYLWYSLIRFQKNMKGLDYFDKVIEAIKSVALKIIKGDLHITDYLMLRSHNDGQKKIFEHYISSSLKIKNIVLDEDFTKTLSNKLNEIENILDQINLLRIYIDIICNDLENKDNLQNAYDLSILNYLDTNLSDFQFRDEIKPFLDLVLKIKPVLNSMTYKNHYLQKEKTTAGTFNMANGIEISLKAYENMVSSLTQIFANIREVQLKDIIEIFPRVSYLEKEYGIIRNLTNLDQEVFELFKICLILLRERENFVNFSISLLDVNTIMSIDVTVCKLCTDFINFNQDLDSKNIGELQKTYSE